mgnify:CR=1 FL=1
MSGSTSNHHFLKCYQDLLARLRENGSDFARQNPEIAPYLDMSNRKSADPEIERLLESFAYLLAQVEHKSTLAQSEYLLQFIENIIPEITQPIPNLVIAQMNVDPTVAAKSSSTTQTLERFTQFRLNNELNEVFYFSNLYERKLTHLKINTAILAQAGATKENLYNNNKAIILKCSTAVPLNLKKQKKTKFAVHIDRKSVV